MLVKCDYERSLIEYSTQDYGKQTRPQGRGQTYPNWAGQLLLKDSVPLSYTLRRFKDNPQKESFFSRFKEEGRSLFLDAQSLPALTTVIDNPMGYHNTHRRHSSIGHVPPLTYIEQVRDGSAKGSPS